MEIPKEKTQIILKERKPSKQYILINPKTNNDSEQQIMKKTANDMIAFIASSIIGLCLPILLGIVYTYKHCKQRKIIHTLQN